MSVVISKDLQNYFCRFIDLPEWATEITITMRSNCTAEIRASGHVDFYNGVRNEWITKRYNLVEINGDDKVNNGKDNAA